MRFGIVARADDRGLGNIAMEVQRNLNPDRTLIVDMGHLARGFAMHPDRYPAESPVVTFDGGMLDESTCRRFLSGLDVVVLFETAYDPRFLDWAREEGCATAMLGMPEFWSSSYPVPTVMWNPTRWRQEHMPPGTVVVPVPVALDRLAGPRPEAGGPLRVLHVAGHRAAHDRNGTTSLLMAARRCRGRMVLTITGQDGHLPTTRLSSNISLRLSPHSAADYWSIYQGHDVIVMPRRYGGLSLPVQEAMGAGLAAVMPDCSPNMDWPVLGLPAHPHGTIRTGAGDIGMVAVSAPDLAETLDRLAGDRGELDRLRDGSDGWAAAHSWDALRPMWLAELASAALAGRAAA